MKVHVKKCHPGPFAALVDGSKTFEWRREDDCKFAVGDLLLLLEWQPEVTGQRQTFDSFGWQRAELEDFILTPAGYTGEVVKRRVTYVLRDAFGVPEGYAVIGLATVSP